MGMMACYTMVNDQELAEFSKLPQQEMLDKLEELNGTHEILDIDKLWDGLHFLLTGLSASTPLEDDPISEAVVGVTNLNEDDFIASIPLDKLNEIVESLAEIDFAKLDASFIPEQFNEAEIYPNIWLAEDKKQLFSELEDTFNNLLLFYRQALLEKMNIIVSIY